MADKLCDKELAFLSLQFEALLKAGISLEDGIDDMCDDMENPEIRAALKSLQENLKETKDLSAALESSKVFPDYMINMAKVGEKTGNLDAVFSSLAKFYEREDKLRETIKSAVTYPLVLILMITAVMGVLVAKVLPVLSKTLENLGGDLPEHSKNAINFGTVLGNIAFYIVLALLLIALILFVVSRFAKGKKAVLKLLGKFPSVHKTIEKLSAARFSSVLSMLIASGCETDETLPLLCDVLPTDETRRRALTLKEDVAEGKDYAAALVKTGFFKGLYPSMIRTGLKTGSLDGVMKYIANTFSDEADDSVNSLVSKIEPCLIAFLCVVVGCVLISDILPLVGIISSLT